jgi:hypothetical protein
MRICFSLIVELNPDYLINMVLYLIVLSPFHGQVFFIVLQFWVKSIKVQKMDYQAKDKNLSQKS